MFLNKWMNCKEWESVAGESDEWLMSSVDLMSSTGHKDNPGKVSLEDFPQLTLFQHVGFCLKICWVAIL